MDPCHHAAQKDLYLSLHSFILSINGKQIVMAVFTLCQSEKCSMHSSKVGGSMLGLDVVTNTDSLSTLGSSGETCRSGLSVNFFRKKLGPFHHLFLLISS